MTDYELSTPVEHAHMQRKIARAASLVRAHMAASGRFDLPRAGLGVARATAAVLRALGMGVEPIAVAPAWISKQAAETDFAQGHSVGVAGTGTIDRDTNSYDGHVALYVDAQWFVDPSAEQFSRPAAAIAINGPLVETIPAKRKRFQPGDACELRRPDGVVAVYRVMQDQHSYETSLDWMGKKPEYRQVIDAVLFELRVPEPSLEVLEAVAAGKPIRCTRCGKGITVVRMPDGEVAFVHDRAWEIADHDPVPAVAADPAELGGVCDFCLDENPVWIYTGPDVILDHATMTGPDSRGLHAMGEQWLACEVCDRYVRAEDLDGLFWSSRRSKPNRKRYEGLSRADLQPIYQELVGNLWPRYIPRITGRRLLHPEPVPHLYARLLPKVRNRLVRLWQDPNLLNSYNSAGRWSVPGPAAGHPDALMVTREHFDPVQMAAVSDGQVRALEFAELYYISKDFTVLAQSSGADLADLSVRPEELPSPSGLMLWQIPIVSMPPDDEGPGADIVACSWSVISGLGVWLTLYVQPEQFIPGATAEQYRERWGYLMPYGAGVGLTFADTYTPGTTPTDAVYRGILATWFLIQQPGVATEDRQTSNDKTLIRKARRAGQPAPDVRVVSLRKHASRASGPTGSRWQVSVRFMVRGHWRRQAYGPQRSLRRTMYIAPFMKGPDGAPLKTGEATAVVKALR